jgi:hypothetical protein
MEEKFTFNIPLFSKLHGDEKYVAQLIRVFQMHYNQELPKVLWHYTTIDTFWKILQSQKIWFAHVSSLNDKAEVLYAVSMMQGTLSGYLSGTTLSSRVQTLLKLAQVRMIDANQDSPWFTASFTELTDSEHHWSEYGDKSKGIAIGFDSKELIRFLSPSANDRVFPVQACYDTQKNLYFASMLITIAILNFEEDFGHICNDDQAASEFLEKWGKHIDPFSVMPKLQSFAAESEWRLARQIQFTTDESGVALMGSPPRKYWPTGRGKNSDSEFQNLPIVSIVVGGHCSQKNFLDIQRELKNYGHAGVILTKSSIS